MNRAYTVLVLILMIPISAHAQSEAESLSNGDASEDYLLMWPEADLWELDFDVTYSEPSWADADALYDVLLELCFDLEVTDEEMYEIFPELRELDYELYLFWEDDWYYWEEE